MGRSLVHTHDLCQPKGGDRVFGSETRCPGRLGRLSDRLTIKLLVYYVYCLYPSRLKSSPIPIGTGDRALTKWLGQEPGGAPPGPVFPPLLPAVTIHRLDHGPAPLAVSLRVLSLPTSRPSYHRLVHDAVPAKQTSVDFPTGDSQKHRICALFDAGSPLSRTRFPEKRAPGCSQPRS